MVHESMVGRIRQNRGCEKGTRERNKVLLTARNDIFKDPTSDRSKSGKVREKKAWEKESVEALSPQGGGSKRNNLHVGELRAV